MFGSFSQANIASNQSIPSASPQPDEVEGTLSHGPVSLIKRIKEESKVGRDLARVSEARMRFVPRKRIYEGVKRAGEADVVLIDPSRSSGS